jgi:hypothetical protein
VLVLQVGPPPSDAGLTLFDRLSQHRTLQALSHTEEMPSRICPPSCRSGSSTRPGNPSRRVGGLEDLLLRQGDAARHRCRTGALSREVPARRRADRATAPRHGTTKAAPSDYRISPARSRRPLSDARYGEEHRGDANVSALRLRKLNIVAPHEDPRPRVLAARRGG